MQQLDTVIQGLIHLDKAGFMQDKLPSDNFRIFCNVISDWHNDNSPTVIAATDAKHI